MHNGTMTRAGATCVKNSRHMQTKQAGTNVNMAAGWDLCTLQWTADSCCVEMTLHNVILRRVTNIRLCHTKDASCDMLDVILLPITEGTLSLPDGHSSCTPYIPECFDTSITLAAKGTGDTTTVIHTSLL